MSKLHYFCGRAEIICDKSLKPVLLKIKKGGMKVKMGQIRRFKNKEITNGGYVRGITLNVISTEENRRLAYIEKAEKQACKKALMNKFLCYFYNEMKKENPELAYLVDTKLFENWRKKRIVKEPPQMFIQIQNLLNEHNLSNSLESACRIYQEFRQMTA